MGNEQLLAYARLHRDRLNLLIHIIAVPVFILGLILVVANLATGNLLAAVVFALVVPVSVAFQGFGHKREMVRPDVFSSPWDFAHRILKEQFYLFPRFVISGEWVKSWRNGAAT